MYGVLTRSTIEEIIYLRDKCHYTKEKIANDLSIPMESVETVLRDYQNTYPYITRNC